MLYYELNGRDLIILLVIDLDINANTITLCGSVSLEIAECTIIWVTTGVALYCCQEDPCSIQDFPYVRRRRDPLYPRSPQFGGALIPRKHEMDHCDIKVAVLGQSRMSGALWIELLAASLRVVERPEGTVGFHHLIKFCKTNMKSGCGAQLSDGD